MSLLLRDFPLSRPLPHLIHKLITNVLGKFYGYCQYLCLYISRRTNLYKNKETVISTVKVKNKFETTVIFFNHMNLRILILFNQLLLL